MRPDACDKNKITRRNAIDQLCDEAVGLRRDATIGIGQMKLVREEITNAPTPVRDPS